MSISTPLTRKGGHKRRNAIRPVLPVGVDFNKWFGELDFVADKQECERSLYHFLMACWPQFDPSPFVDGWHLRMVADHLQAVTRGEIKRLLINIPPRHGKTLLVAVAWPLWTWIQEPKRSNPLLGAGVRFLCSSYGANKAQGDGVTARRVIDQPWFQARWGDRVKIVKNQDNQEQYSLTQGGYRISTGIPESIGKGGLIRVVDDPHKPDEVESKLVIATQIQAYNEVWRTRSNDPKGGAEVIIMQRLGEDDLSGHILANDDDFTHLYLPCRYEPDRQCITQWGSDPRTRDGELLWPGRYDDAWATLQAEKLGAYGWAGQYQQRPEPRGGGIIKRDSWVQYGPDDPKGLKFPRMDYVLVSVDTAMSEKTSADYTAVVTLGVWKNQETGHGNVMVIHAWRDRISFRGMASRVNDTCGKYHAHQLIIENRTVGSPLEEELRADFSRYSYGVSFSPAQKVDKTARLHSISHLFEDGMVHYPNTTWAQMLIDEVSIYPRGAHDDLADGLAYGLRYLRDNSIIHRVWEHKEMELREHRYRGRSESRSLYPV